MVDAAHIAGLIAGGAHPSPVPYADVVTFTTHKTLRGPRAGAILCREQYAAAIDKAVFPGLQGGPLMHVIAAKAVAFHEALQPEFRDYAAQIVRNAAALADALAAEGFRIVSGGTDNHLMLVDLRPVRRHRQGRAGGARPRPGSPATRTRSRTTPRSRSSPAACASAPPRSPPRAWREPEMARDRVADRAACCATSTTRQVAADVREPRRRLCAQVHAVPRARR